MIRAGRMVHRRMFSLLAFLVPGILFVGLALRPDVPPLSQPDPMLLTKAGFATNTPNQLTRLQAGEQTFEMAIETNSSQTTSLIIRSIHPLLKPDLLVYWVQETIENDSLPGNAILLGELLGTSFARMAFPEGTSTNRGTLVIYSQAHQDVFAQFAIPSLVETRKGLMNIPGLCPIDASGKMARISGRECSKKFVQQGRSPLDARSVLLVREHGKRARTPLATFFNIPRKGAQE